MPRLSLEENLLLDLMADMVVLFNALTNSPSDSDSDYKKAQGSCMSFWSAFAARTASYEFDLPIEEIERRGLSNPSKIDCSEDVIDTIYMIAQKFRNTIIKSESIHFELIGLYEDRYNNDFTSYLDNQASTQSKNTLDSLNPT